VVVAVVAHHLVLDQLVVIQFTIRSPLLVVATAADLVVQQPPTMVATADPAVVVVKLDQVELRQVEQVIHLA